MTEPPSGESSRTEGESSDGSGIAPLGLRFNDSALLVPNRAALLSLTSSSACPLCPSTVIGVDVRKSLGVFTCTPGLVACDCGVNIADPDTGGGVSPLFPPTGVWKNPAPAEYLWAGLSAPGYSGAELKLRGRGEGTVDGPSRGSLPPPSPGPLPGIPVPVELCRLTAKLCMSAFTISLLIGVIDSKSSLCPLVDGSKNEPRNAYTLLNSGRLAGVAGAGVAFAALCRGCGDSWRRGVWWRADARRVLCPWV